MSYTEHMTRRETTTTTMAELLEAPGMREAVETHMIAKMFSTYIVKACPACGERMSERALFYHRKDGSCAPQANR